MKNLNLITAAFLASLLTIACVRDESKLEIYATTDLHGMLLPFDNTEGEATDRSLANLAPLVEELLALRERFRKRKEWQEADSIRDCLERAKIILEDTPEGPRWRAKPLG